MKITFFFILVFVTSFSFSQTSEQKADQFLKSQPRVYFKENKGQVSDQHYQPRPDVLFYGSDGAMNFHMRKDGISYQLTRVDSWKELDEHMGMLDKCKSGIRHLSKTVPDQQTIYRVDVNWLGANQNVETQRGKAIQGIENYYNTPNPDGVLGVRSFESVQFTNLYEGIDLKYYEHDGHLKYDYIIAPGADFKQIQLEYMGATSISIDKEGNLLVETPLGTMYEPLPLVIQSGKQLEAHWQIIEDVVSFEIENYDPTEAIIIDPLVRVWGTYVGSNKEDYLFYCDTDKAGNLIVSGSSFKGSTSIATVGSFMSIQISSQPDGLLGKYSQDGIKLWMTYYGSNQEWDSFVEAGGRFVVDSMNNIFWTLMSYSNSTNLITTGSAQTVKFANGSSVIVKFNENGNRIWATFQSYYLSEFNESVITDIVLDNDENLVLLCSRYDELLPNYIVKGYFYKLSNDGTSLLGCSPLYSYDTCFITFRRFCTKNNKIYVFGETNKTGLASTGVFQEVSYPSSRDCFVAEFNSENLSNPYNWLTYFGGIEDEFIGDCAISDDGIIVTGTTYSPANFNSADAFQNTIPNWPGYSAYLLKFDFSGNRLFGTYFGNSFTNGFCCDVDSVGNIFIGGKTDDSLFPTSYNCYQSYHNGGEDGFFAQFSSSGELIYSSLFGGESAEQIYSLCEKTGNLFLVGLTSSNTGIATEDASQFYHGGSNPNPYVEYWMYDGFINKFNNLCKNYDFAQISGDSSLVLGQSTQLLASGGENYSWQPPTGLSCTDCPNPIVQPEVSTQYTVTVTDSNGCVNTKKVFVNINTDGCIYIPNIFSPNKDQKNDEFCLYGSCLKSGTFTIYNRWGEKVFETTDIKNCWDGTYKGEPVNSDVFVYKLNGVLVTGEVIEESGSIEVVR